MLQELDHPHVVVYIDVFLHQVPEERSRCLQVCTVMDYCAGGDLAERLHRGAPRGRGARRGPDARRGWRRWPRGSRTCTTRFCRMGWCTGDVKPQNILHHAGARRPARTLPRAARPPPLMVDWPVMSPCDS